jgi:hypothetical protein
LPTLFHLPFKEKTLFHLLPRCLATMYLSLRRVRYATSIWTMMSCKQRLSPDAEPIIGIARFWSCTCRRRENRSELRTVGRAD